MLATIAAVLWPRNFSGSGTVTSRNPLIHNGATTATKSERFDPKKCTRFFCHGVAAAPDRPFATVNFRELWIGEVRSEDRASKDGIPERV